HLKGPITRLGCAVFGGEAPRERKALRERLDNRFHPQTKQILVMHGVLTSSLSRTQRSRQMRPVYAFACKAASSLGTNLFTQNIFLLPLTTTTSPSRSNAAICWGSSVAGSSCQPSARSAGTRSYKWRISAQFQHVAENGDAPAGLHRPRLQATERGHHAGRVAVKTVVDHGDAMGHLLHTTAGHDADMIEFFRQRRRIQARGMDRRQRGQRVLQAMRRTGR